MNKFSVVLKHTFLSNVKTKSFKITTIITSIFLLLLFNLPEIMSVFDKDETTQIGMIDQSNQVSLMYKEQLKSLSENINIIDIDNENIAKIDLDEGKIAGYILVEALKEGKINAAYKSHAVNDSGMINKLEQGLNQVQFRLMARQLGLTTVQAGKLFEPASLDRIPLDDQAKSEEEMVQSTVLVYILLFAMYFNVLMYGNLVASEVAKEKSTRVMEILISSVNPIVQMFGKILGIALLGLFQIAIFVLIGYVSMQFGSKTIEFADLMLDFSQIPISTVFYAIIFFILGYLLFSTISAMLGSLVNKVEDLQQTITPLNLVIIAAFMIAMFGLSKPEATFIIISSYIPFFTPMIMFLRVGLSNPPIWEILLSIALLILTIAGIAILAAKVYRGGVLMYGKGASFKDLKKALAFHKD